MAARPRQLDTTVTFLEMTVPPAKRYPLPLGTNAALLQTVKPPPAFYRYLQFQVGHRWHWEQRVRMDDATLTEIIHADTTEIFTLMLNGAPAGFFEINRANRQAPDIAYFGMMDHATGRGLGRWFVGCAIETCWTPESTVITVNTCTLDHPAALPLYQKMGFVPVRRAPGRVKPLTRRDLHRLAEQGIAST